MNIVKSKAKKWLESLGYLVIPRWQVSAASTRQSLESLGYILLAKANLRDPTVIRQFESLGYVWAETSKLWSLPLSTHLRKVFNLFEIDCVLDVGANVGQYRNFLRNEVGYAGLIVSFEPIPTAVQTLQELAQHDPKWMIVDCALGSVTGQATFNITKETQFSSFLTPDNTSTRSLDDGKAFAENNIVAQQVVVPVRTLDNCFPELERRHNCRNVYLKLDTQGFDLEVVKGAAQTLPKISALQTEASVVPIYAGMPNYVTSIETLQRCGFALSGIYPNNDYFPRLIEFDCVMIKDSSAGKLST